MIKKALLALPALLLILLVIVLLWAGNYFFDLAFLRTPKEFLEDNPNLEDKDTSSRSQSDADNQAWLSAQQTETMAITSDDGLKLVGTYISAPEPAGRTAILVHGYAANRQSMLGFARVFVEELGYHVLMPDMRAHGDSEGEIIGFGWLDRFDVIRWIERVLQQHSPEEQIVLYGISMGGSTVMMTAGETLPGNVKAIIEDCGYTSVKDELAVQMKQLYGLPSFPLIQATSLVTRHRAGFYLGDASAVQQVKKTSLPILFIHGEADTFVPYAMLQPLYEAAAGPKEWYAVPGAGHGEAYSANPEQYVATLRSFLDKYISQ